MANVPTIKKGDIEKIRNEITVDQKKHDFNFPQGFNIENAIENAVYELTKPQSGGNILSKVTNQQSVINAIKNMAILGLNPVKKQCYLIPYAGNLTCQPSYYGELAILRRILPVKQINAQVIFEGDKFLIETDEFGSQKYKHEQALQNKDNDFTGAYAIVEFEDGSVTRVVMTRLQILEAWKMSKMNPIQDGKIKPGSTHARFQESMAKRTVLRKLANFFIAQSDDSDYLVDVYQKTKDSEYIDNPDTNDEQVVDDKVENLQAKQNLDFEDAEFTKEEPEDNKSDKKEDEISCDAEPEF